MQKYPIRYGRTTDRHPPSEEPNRDVFIRAVALLLCGTFVCLAYFSSSLADLSDDAIAVAAISDPTEEIDDSLVCSGNDDSVWAYLENAIRRMLSYEGD